MLKGIQSQMSKVRDERIKVSNEVLGGMKVIKSVNHYFFMCKKKFARDFFLFTCKRLNVAVQIFLIIFNLLYFLIYVNHNFSLLRFVSNFDVDQVIKFQAWEGEFEKRINDIRDREMALFKRWVERSFRFLIKIYFL